MIKRFYVDRDYQYGDFGMGRNYTAEQWLEQAKEWAEMDGNDGILKELNKIQNDFEKQVLGYIAEFWSVHFRKTNKRHRTKNKEIFDYNKI